MSGPACAGGSSCTCGCCSGIAVMTPQGETNPPGAPAIAYRTGTWATFKDSMLARLSSSTYPALAGLKTRDDDDFSIALLDASAVILDILTFYQERLANESYLRTATQIWSLTQLCRLIGYQPSPGVSASTYLAFTLTAAPGLPVNPTTGAITVPAGTTVQSVAAQGQSPQTFQTSAAIFGKPDWNALPIQTGVAWSTDGSQTRVWLSGTATQLQPGDAFLIVGDANATDPTTQPWRLGYVTAVQTDTTNQRTLVSWGGAFASSETAFPKDQPSAFYALRQRAALFGYNAVNPQMLSYDTQSALYGAGLLTAAPTPPPTATSPTPTPSSVPGPEWVFQAVGGFGFDLDAVYSKVVAPGWIAAILPEPSETPPWGVLVWPLQSVNTTTRSDYGVSGKVTRTTLVEPGDPWAAAFLGLAIAEIYGSTRTASVLAQSELLAAGEQPLDHPLYGTFLDLEVVRDDLAGVAAVAVIGKSQKVTVNTAGLKFHPYDSSSPEPLNPGDVLTLLQPPPIISPKGEIPDWTTSKKAAPMIVADSQGRAGTLRARVSDFTLTASASTDPVVQEIGLVSSIGLTGPPGARRTRIILQAPLVNCYERATTSVNCNVAAATGGGAVTELLGSGSATTPNQSFTLKQSPLTYAPAQTPSGSQSSLQVTVNGATWTPVQTLYGQPPTAQVYQTINEAGGTTRVLFGDGIEGALLPTGANNIAASYRIGLGQAGNVGAATITTLVDRPLGVKGVVNPMAATGGQDAQALAAIRANAPQTVVTLGRAVSITDYQTFAATFAGVAKASAIWIPNGPNRGVFVTVAGAGGASLQGSQTLIDLTTALSAYGDPGVLVQVQSFYETLFGLNADIAYDPACSAPAVQAAVMATLTSTYSFAARDFGQGVSADEIAALIQGTTGVVAVNVKKLSLGPTSAAGDLGSGGWSVAAWNSWILQQKTLARPDPHSATHICPYIPVAQIGALPAPADILVLNPDPSAVILGVMG